MRITFWTGEAPLSRSRPHLDQQKRPHLNLSAEGMRVPQLARHFGCCEATVRRWLHHFAADGLRSLRHQPRGAGPDVARRQAVRRALNGMLSRKRTWTATQLAEALAAEKGIVMRPRTVRKYLPTTCARSTSCATGWTGRRRPRPGRSWTTLKKARTDQLRLFFLDESGFALTQPPTHSWCRRRHRPEVPHESPQDQRVDVMAVQAAPGATPTPPLTWWAAPHSWKSEHLLAFLRHALPAGDGLPRVVVDGQPLHAQVPADPGGRGGAGGAGHRTALPALPGPELNDIERTFRKAKHEAMPRRMQPHQRALTAAVHACFRDLRDELASLHLSTPDA